MMNTLIDPTAILTDRSLVTKGATLREMIEVAHTMQDVTKERSYGIKDVRPEVLVTEEGKYRDTLVIGDKLHSFTPFAKSQYLSALGIPEGFFDSCDPDLREYMMNRRHSAGMALNLSFLELEDQNVIRGVTTSRTQPMKQVELLEELESYLQRRGGEYMVMAPYLSSNLLSFKLVLDDRANPDPSAHHVLRVADGDDYIQGIQFMNSENGFSRTLISPMLLRAVCSNGLIDIKAQEQMVKRKNINVPRDAVRITVDGVFDWLDSNAGLGLFNAMKALHDSGDTYSQKKAIAILNDKFSKRVPKDVFKPYADDILKLFPEGIDNPQVLAYDFVNEVTLKAQPLNQKLRNVIECNVGEFLTSRS